LQIHWDFIYRDLQTRAISIEGLVYYLDREDDDRFNPQELDYHPYGEGVGEDRPPWREEELRQNLQKAIDYYQDALRDIENAKEQLKRKPDIDELRQRYTTLGRGKLKKNASEKSLRAAYQQEWEEKLTNSQKDEKHWETKMLGLRKALEAFLEKK
jgi:hypothetical protein